MAIHPYVETTRLFPIFLLKEHEETYPPRYIELKAELVRDGFQRDPIIIDKKYNIVLDGHHRLNILKSLGYSKIAAFQADYENPKVLVKTWYPLIMDSIIDPSRLFRRYFVDAKPDNQKESFSKLFLNGITLTLNLDRETTIRMLHNKVKLQYVNTEKLAAKIVNEGKAMAALSFRPISKEEVIKRALLGKKLPPKTTQHIIPNRPKDWYIPFEKLK
jgi:uncharacterized protein (DUF1015 family)